MSKKNKKRKSITKKAMVINKNRKFLDCISVGDRITEVGTVGNENLEHIGILIRTGHVTKAGIYYDFCVIISPECYDDVDTYWMMVDKLSYGKYIICADACIAGLINEIKIYVASKGIELGELFVYNNKHIEELNIKDFL